MTTVSIIGTAGRSGTKELYEQMIVAATIYLKSLPSPLIVVSGGAAFADHVAVHVYLNQSTYNLNITELHLNLPCPFDMEKRRFHDTGVPDWRMNPGKVANYYHDKFNQITSGNSYDEIYEAIQRGAHIHIHSGFHDRNQYVAKSEYVLAFTFGKNEPEDGGTKHTWDLCKGKKYHISLAS